MKVYLAAPFGTKKSVKRRNAKKAKKILESRGFEVYAPWEVFIPNAWDIPNNEWARLVYENDVNAINNADMVVALSYGRKSTTSGTNWECGYAFGIKKKLIIVEMTDSIMSLMISNGCNHVIKGLPELSTFDFDSDTKHTTETEQK